MCGRNCYSLVLVLVLLSPFSLSFTTRHIRFPVYSPRVKYNPMSEPTNSTTDPFASGTSDAAHGSLYKAIGLSLAIGSSKYYHSIDIHMHDYLVTDVLK